MLHFRNLHDTSGWADLAPEGVKIERRDLTSRSFLVSLEPKGPARPHGCADVVIAPPLSGHSGTLMLDIVQGLLAGARVHVVEPIAPEALPQGLGEGCFEDQVEAIEVALARVGPAHLVGACQSTAAAIEAPATLPGRASSAPLSLTLLAAPLVAAPGSGGVAQHLPGDDPEALSAFLDRIDGLISPCANGQAVLPGDLQLAAILGGSGGAARILMEEGCISWNFAVSPDRRAQARGRTRALTRTTSIERGLLFGALQKNFIDRSHMKAGGAASHITCPVQLIVAGDDTVIPPQQSLAGQHVFNDVSITIVEGADHFDLFCGESAAKIATTLHQKFLP